MPTIFNQNDQCYQNDEHPHQKFGIQTAFPRLWKKANSENLVFDFRRPPPAQYSFPYHFHHNAEEIIFILSGEMTMRSPEGFQEVKTGDLIFFEIGESGAHQFYNHTEADCIYFDLRTAMGIDVSEYPDSGKINILPAFDIFVKGAQADYFDGEEKVEEQWSGWRKNSNHEEG